MKLVMTLLARDEADIVDAQVAYHLHAGVDFVIAMDHGSQDGTSEILERYERAGRLHLLRQGGDDVRQGEWVTRMARLAATEFGADWVIHSDADEFWWPRAGSLKDVFATVPERFGVIRGCWRHFVPRPHGDPFFAERMTVRLCAPAHPGDKATIFHAHQKVAHRSHPEVVIEPGNHNAVADGLEPIRGWHPIEVLHFSLRSVEQVARKAVRGWDGWLWNERERTLHQALVHDALRQGRIDEYYESFVVTDEALERGVAAGRLQIDTRLRDALRSVREGSGFGLPEQGESPLFFPHPDVEADAAYAAEASILVEIDGIVRAAKRVDALEDRLAALERGPVSRLRRLPRR